ncbi:MAG: radical SAM protein [Ruminococcus sp.]|nr:radical SAM protein [Ruminococcus sp.]
MKLDKKLLECCRICPRECGINRYETKGFCMEGADIRIARAELHFWEEPCISGENGSGTVFFSGCPLKCCYCQNYEISANNKGFVISPKQLADTFIMLQDRGAHNINLVNPTHFAVQIKEAFDFCKDKLKIPIVYNCGGYEKTEIIDSVAEFADIFLPDLKYFDGNISQRYSKAEDYFDFCSKSIKEMVKVSGKPAFDENGILISGVVVRHLVLPNHRHDSIKLMNWLGQNFAKDEILVSVMCQYTPVFKAENYKEINRKTSTFEYNSVCDVLQQYGFNGYFQQKSSAQTDFIPKFYDKLYYKLL